MPRLKSILKRHQVEVAERKRTCKHNRSRKIARGEPCLVVFDDERARFCYSREVALGMIAEARKALTVIEDALRDGRSG
ncbi:MAG: hypothetical protein IMF16_06560 [Proteobacteria bacterium]|nr:hypothetical protein [Pseudomonadota bacterium]